MNVWSITSNPIICLHSVVLRYRSNLSLTLHLLHLSEAWLYNWEFLGHVTELLTTAIQFWCPFSWIALVKL